jgi:hypothetical protein
MTGKFENIIMMFILIWVRLELLKCKDRKTLTELSGLQGIITQYYGETSIMGKRHER